MKNTGINSIGRIKLPIELCESLDIKTNDHITFLREGKQIVLGKSYSDCIFCHSKENILDFENKKICQNCINKFTEEVYEKFKGKGNRAKIQSLQANRKNKEVL